MLNKTCKTVHVWPPFLVKDTGLLTIRGKKSQISRDFWGQNRGKIGRFRGNFAGIFRANLAGKQSVKNGGFCGYLQGKFRKKSIGFALIRPAFLMFF